MIEGRSDDEIYHRHLPLRIVVSSENLDEMSSLFK